MTPDELASVTLEHLRAIREAQDWERAYIKEMIRQERQARKQAEEVRS